MYRVPEDDPNGIEIEGRDGLFREKSSIHNKYMSRPKSLEKICLAQFAMMYEKTTSKAKEDENESNEDCDDYKSNWNDNDEYTEYQS